MRGKILFRGKRLDNSEWVEGVPIWSDNNRCYMIVEVKEDKNLNSLCQVKYAEVNPETLYQLDQK